MHKVDAHVFSHASILLLACIGLHLEGHGTLASKAARNVPLTACYGTALLSNVGDESASEIIEYEETYCEDEEEPPHNCTGVA